MTREAGLSVLLLRPLGQLVARLDAHVPGPAEAARLDAYEARLLSTLRSGHADEAAEKAARRAQRTEPDESAD